MPRDKDWSSPHARAHLLRIAADLVEDESFTHEAAALAIRALIREHLNVADFRAIIEDELEWDGPTLDAAVDEVRLTMRKPWKGAAHG